MMKFFVLALVFVGMIFLSGCNLDRNIAFDAFNSGDREVGLHGGQFMAYSTEELKVMLTEHCRETCPSMDYEYRNTKYTVYEEGGMYVARDPKCLCFDPNYKNVQILSD
jgi:hypothetical protein